MLVNNGIIYIKIERGCVKMKFLAQPLLDVLECLKCKALKFKLKGVY